MCASAGLATPLCRGTRMLCAAALALGYGRGVEMQLAAALMAELMLQQPLQGALQPVSQQQLQLHGTLQPQFPGQASSPEQLQAQMQQQQQLGYNTQTGRWLEGNPAKSAATIVSSCSSSGCSCLGCCGLWSNVSWEQHVLAHELVGPALDMSAVVSTICNTPDQVGV